MQNRNFSNISSFLFKMLLISSACVKLCDFQFGYKNFIILFRPGKNGEKNKKRVLKVLALEPCICHGEPWRIRTSDTLIKSQVLYLLS